MKFTSLETNLGGWVGGGGGGGGFGPFSLSHFPIFYPLGRGGGVPRANMTEQCSR